MNALIALAVQAVLAALIALLALCALVGAAVAIRPSLIARLKGAAERRVSLRRATRGVDIPRNADSLFYRHHRLYGGIVVVLAIFLLYVLAFGGTERWGSLLTGEYRALGAAIIDAARIVLWLAAIFALIVGTIVFVRPSALKRLETFANRWLTPRRYTYPLEREYKGLDEHLGRYPRAWGTIIALVSVGCILALIAQWPA